MSYQVSKTRWKNAKTWVYSITFDEALADLFLYAVPICNANGIIGHVEAVSSQIGCTRNLGASSYNGFDHMSAAEMKQLLDMGWGVGCHSHTHGTVMDNPKVEIGESKKILEEALGCAVVSFVAPGSNANLTKPVRELLPCYGFLAGYGITDRLNRSDEEDLFNLGRIPLHERYGGVFDSVYDPYKRIMQAQVEQGWIVDYCHCPLPQAVHECKDCTVEHLEQRVKAVRQLGGQSLWAANPDRVVDYMLTRENTTIERVNTESEKTEAVFEIKDTGIPEQVSDRSLTLAIEPQNGPLQYRLFWNDQPANPYPLDAKTAVLTVEVKKKNTLRIEM